jgi:hypothetical protein
MRVLLSYVFVLALIASVAVQAQSPAGGEFRVGNATAVGDTLPSVAADASGAFVVTWNDNSVSRTVKARQFDPLGVPRTAPFVVSPAIGFRSSVAADDKGRHMVVWQRYDNGSIKVAARSFDASGIPIGSEFLVDTPPNRGYEPAVAASRAGTFVVVWHDFFQDGSGDGIAGRRVGLWGNAVSPTFSVNSFTTGNQYEASVAADERGGFVVVWTGAGDGSASGVFGRVFDVAGLPIGPEFRVNTYTTGRQFDPQVVADAVGNFVVVWQDSLDFAPGRIFGRRFDATGSPQGAEFMVATLTTAALYDISAAGDRAGNFTVMWESPDGSGDGVFGRRFTAGGLPRGAQFRVNTSTTSAQRFPDVASDASGNLFASWVSPHGGVMDIYGQRFGGLVPTALNLLESAPGGNGVLEVGDTFTAQTSWRNLTGGSATFQGNATDLSVPAGLVMTLSPLASYVTVANGSVASCGGPCFAGTLTGSRPAGHADVTFLETVVPDVQGQTKRWRLHVGDSFTDVPRTSPFYTFVETLLHHDVSGGCTAGQFCPAGATTREQMAPFVLVAKEGAGYAPPGCISTSFADVPAASPYCPFIHELARRGVVAGCAPNLFCPTAAVTREQMAVFALRTLDPALDPPACTTPMFADVPASSPFCRWIEEVARRGIASGCGGGNYCPAAAVTREQMAVFLGGTFGLTLYGP